MNDQDRVRLDKIEKTLEQLSSKLDKVIYAIGGNDLDGNRGIVYRLEQVETKLQDVDDLLTKTKWMAIGWGMGLGLVGGGISSSIISKLLS